MNFALLGDDPAVLPLVRAIARHQQHRIECAALAGTLQLECQRIAPGLRILPGWDLILMASVDTVIVCGSEPAVLEAARQIAAAGKPLAIFPAGAQGSTWIYELGLIRDEGRTALVPVFPDRLRPAVRALREALDSGALGRVLYLQLDREIASREAGDGPPLLTREQVEDALLFDVDLLRSLAGDYGRVSAVHSGAVGDRMAAAAATLLGEQLPEATWTVHGSAGESLWKLVIAGEKGEAIVTARDEDANWTVRTERVTIPELASLPAFDEGECILKSLEKSGGQSPREADWSDLVRDFEVVDGARSSARRRRGVDLHLETTSERNIFKSHMTAVGCLLLTFTLVGVVFLLLVMPLFDVRSRTQLEAERADAIVRDSDFAPGTATINARGTDHLRRVAARMEQAPFPVLVLENKGAAGRRQAERRRDAVVTLLTKEGVKGVAERTQIGPVVGEWYPHVLEVVRVLAFLPLALFLFLQVLVFLDAPGGEIIAEHITQDAMSFRPRSVAARLE